MEHSPRYLTAALYKFVDLPDYEAMHDPLLACCEANHVKGTLLLASEGINGTIAGPEEGVRKVLAYLHADPRLSTLQHKEAWSDKPPFLRMKVRLKKEIVTLRVPELDPNKTVGRYVKPADWNALLADPDVVVIDTRNDYEVVIGSFKGAINPDIKTFTELLPVADGQTGFDTLVFPLKTRQQLGQKILGGAHHADGQHADLQPLQSCRRVFGVFQRRDDPPRVNQHVFAHRGQRHLAALALKQRHAHVAFQFLDLHGHGGRREVQNLGGAGKTEVFGDLGENPELADSRVLH